MSVNGIVLVTGGAGYIGSHMVAQLVQSGREVVVVDNLSKGHRDAVHANAKFYEGDIADGDLMARIFTAHKIDVVVHFAAYTEVAESMAKPELYYGNNLHGTISLLRSMLDHGVKKIVFSSTAAVYGIPNATPIPEDAPTQPINPYGESKLAVERALYWFYQAHGLRYITLRYFNVAGAHEDATIGEAHNPETHLIPIIIEAALGKRDALNIYGADYSTQDGTCIRDYVHVMDLVDAHILAMEKLAAGVQPAIYNVGSGTGFSNLQLVEAVKRITGVTFPVNYGARRLGDPPVLIAQCNKIKEELGWNPARTNVETIIKTALAWHSYANKHI